MVALIGGSSICVAPRTCRAITVTPSWETPEVISDDTRSGTLGERMQGQDRWLDFDHFGLAGVVVPGASASENNISYRQRLPAAGWTPALSIVVNGALQSSFQYNRAEQPIMVSIDSMDNELLLSQPNDTGFGFSTRILVDGLDGPEEDRAHSGTSLAIDPLGRTAIAFVEDRNSFGRQLTYLLDLNGDGCL